MDELQFINLRPYLYHLTDERNIENIFNTKSLLSTKKIVESSDISNKEFFLRNRRPVHEIIRVDGVDYRIRDQRPISLLALSKCLSNNWITGDFIEHLNKRVYFWCSLDRLYRHFNRYVHENPRIIKCRTVDVLQLNGDNVEYCRINSGATRANPYLGGVAPLRGLNTFLNCHLYSFPPRSVVEVTVLEECTLPRVCLISDSPEGPWENISFS